MINHHPDEGLLLALAAGRLGGGHALLLASHLEGCAHCRQRLAVMESIGGVLLDEQPPAAMSPLALEKTMAAIDAIHPAEPAEAPEPVPDRHPPLPPGMAWPRALHGCPATGWRWLAPGMRWSRVTLPFDPAAKVFLLRIGAGRELPVHSHSDSELTQVLHGAFHDGRSRFAPGDFDEADGSFHHVPRVEAGGECICLASVEGRMLFQGRVARVMGALVGM